MAERITQIKEVFGVDGGDGYKITTTEQEILVLIDNRQDCCESWGYVTSEDNLASFVGSELLGVKLVDSDMNVSDFDMGSLEDGDAVFVNFDTSAGLFQLVMYNQHNGYYGHRVTVRSKTLNHQQWV